ncbi:MAG: Fic family protein [Pseudobutyrivibrio sp.]|nr:Fic family protein [Pseudobutyrivibrio sp.]
MIFSDLLKEKQIKKTDFINKTGIGKTTLTYYLNGKRDIDKADLDTIYKMAGVLNITPVELIKSVKEEVLKNNNKTSKKTNDFIIKTPEHRNNVISEELKELAKHILQPKFNEKLIEQYKFDLSHQDRQGVYANTQRALSYNSSRIEGNTLTPDETAELFNTGTIGIDGHVYKPKDVEEMTGHFSMFNRCIATLDKPLTEELIKEYHFALENGVFEFIANGGVPGEYKKVENRVHDIKTVLPDDVSLAMKDLLRQYNSSEKTLETLARFHAAYEIIHPFKDGNGRTGRMILFRESLLNGIDPFIVEDKNKLKYYKALHKAQTEEIYDDLINFFEEEQEAFLIETIPFLIAKEEYQNYMNDLYSVLEEKE